MFRKNFREGGKSGGGCGGGGGLKGSKSFSSGRNANKQRARDMSLSLQDDVHYRTHLFFSASRPSNTDEGDLICALKCLFLQSILSCPSHPAPILMITYSDTTERSLDNYVI